ncbi:hypothetical protein KLP40_19310 [Hymenobacter sp. NST-14]|uniref:helix-turn-helix domain-containing protein n=1 Tax=Hymenobacter piscis TaxID=2839984 RepID=UPI001C032F86|nr:hypothetical protein [Hymenobacter piscis]MBT9395324.1 hypothetical protein [Hymenobacter piscis]
MNTLELTVNQRIQHLIDNLEKGSQAAFARKIGVRTGTIGDILGKRQSKPGYEILAKIVAAYPELRADWLLGGDGDMLKRDPNMMMEPVPAPTITFSQADVDARFMEEVQRLRYEGAFNTYSELATVLQAHRSIISEIQSGRYHCTLKLVYMLDAHYEIDLLYIIRGDGSKDRPQMPKPQVAVGRPAARPAPAMASITQTLKQARNAQLRRQRIERTKDEPVWRQMLYTFIGDVYHPEVKSDSYLRGLALQLLPLFERDNGPVEDQEDYLAMIQREARAYAATLPEESILLPNTNTNSDTTK